MKSGRAGWWLPRRPRTARRNPYSLHATVQLTPHERDKLLLSVAAMVARDRRARGVQLNHPEAVALISSFVLEGHATGGRSPS